MSAPVKCPECGNEQGLYARADIRWNVEQQGWIICDLEQVIDCTECDAEFELPADWPHPLHP